MWLQLRNRYGDDFVVYVHPYSTCGRKSRTAMASHFMEISMGSLSSIADMSGNEFDLSKATGSDEAATEERL